MTNHNHLHRTKPPRSDTDKLLDILGIAFIASICALAVSCTALFFYDLYKRGAQPNGFESRFSGSNRASKCQNTKHWIINYLDAKWGAVMSYAALVGGSLYLVGYPAFGAFLAILIGSIGLIGSLASGIS